MPGRRSKETPTGSSHCADSAAWKRRRGRRAVCGGVHASVRMHCCQDAVLQRLFRNALPHMPRFSLALVSAPRARCAVTVHPSGAGALAVRGVFQLCAFLCCLTLGPNFVLHGWSLVHPELQAHYKNANLCLVSSFVKVVC